MSPSSLNLTWCIARTLQGNGHVRSFSSTPITVIQSSQSCSQLPRPRRQFGLSRSPEVAESSEQGRKRLESRGWDHHRNRDSNRTDLAAKPILRARFGLRQPTSTTAISDEESNHPSERLGNEGASTKERPEGSGFKGRVEDAGTRQARRSAKDFPRQPQRHLPMTTLEDRSDEWREGAGSMTPNKAGNADTAATEAVLKDRAWQPTKKLTYQAMAGLRSLHSHDPKTFDKATLSQRFGISYDAVSRILRSNYQDKKGGGGSAAHTIQGTKWDMNPGTSRLSPVPAVARAFEQRQRAGALRPVGAGNRIK
jgi:hypothetical protein